MTMTLGDAFNERKKVGAELEKWTNRLRQAGFLKREFTTKSIEGDGSFEPEPGSLRVSERHYTIEECQSMIESLIAQDQDLALRISATNQVATGTVVDLDGNERTLSVPALLVLRNDIIPKLEEVARATPVRSEDVNLIEEADGHIVHRSIKRIERKREIISEQGHKIEEIEIEGYKVVDVTEFGGPRRAVWDHVDRIQAYAAGIKQALNDANRTELVELEEV